MKKIVIIFSLMILGFSDAAIAGFSGGLKIGFNASKYTGSFASSYKFTPGVHIGPYFRISIKEKYRIQAEVLFSTKGSALPIAGETFYELPFYLDVPVMFNYMPVGGLYIEAGVQPSYALTAMQFSANTETEFNKADIKSMDFAPVAGLGYQFEKISLGLRGNFGVSNIDNISTSSFEKKNLTLMATFGFKF